MLRRSGSRQERPAGGGGGSRGAASFSARGLARSYSKRVAVTARALGAASGGCWRWSAAAPASAASCPSFRVLHDDRIGAAVLPAGNYEVTVEPDLGAGSAPRLAVRPLPRGLRRGPAETLDVTAEGTGKASFTRGGLAGSRSPQQRRRRRRRRSNPALGKLCPAPFTVNAGPASAPCSSPRASTSSTSRPASGITCRRGSVLFTRFLAAPGGTLPSPVAPAQPDGDVLQAGPPGAVGIPDRARGRRLLPPSHLAPSSARRSAAIASGSSSSWFQVMCVTE